MLRLGLDAAGLAVFLLTALAVFLLLHHGQPTRLTPMTGLAAIGVARAWRCSRACCWPPGSPAARATHRDVGVALIEVRIKDGFARLRTGRPAVAAAAGGDRGGGAKILQATSILKVCYSLSH
jgi:hypothetical protein